MILEVFAGVRPASEVEHHGVFALADKGRGVHPFTLGVEQLVFFHQRKNLHAGVILIHQTTLRGIIPLNIMDDVFQRPLSLIDVNQLSDEELLQQKWVGPVSMAFKHIRAENIKPYAMAIFEALTRWPLDHPETVELLKLLLNYLFDVGNINDVDAFIEVDMNRLSGPIRSEVMTIAEKLREEGEQKGLEKAALMMLREGVEIAFIAKVTNLSVADIERLKATLKNGD